MAIEELLGFNPCSNWTMFLMKMWKLIKLSRLCFNPYFNWTMFLMRNISYANKRTRLVLILILTGQCFLFHSIWYLTSIIEGFNPYFNWTMFLINNIKSRRMYDGRFNPYFNWTMFLIAFFYLFPFIYLFYDRKYVAVFP